jgi:hypothetical protein
MFHPNSNPSTGLFAITPHDTNKLAEPAKGLYCSVAGDLKITTFRGDIVSLAMVAGGVLPVQVIQVWDTGTDATVFGFNG